jgi:hypothetical protein
VRAYGELCLPECPPAPLGVKTFWKFSWHRPRQSCRSLPGLFSERLAVVDYSVRSATIGLTRVARRAGTKQEIAATKVKRPATTR